MTKLEGLFGFKLKDKFEEEKFKIIYKQDQIQDDWDDDALNEFIYEIENPLIPNEMFSEYWIGCSSVDKTITSIGANISQKSYPIYEPQELLNVSGNGISEPFVHCHVTISDNEYKARGGHLFSAKIAVIAEINITLLRHRHPARQHAQAGRMFCV